MTDSTRDFFDTLAKVLLRCWIISFALGAFSFVVFMLTGEIIDDIHGRWFGVTPHELDLIIYCGLGFFKLFVLIFFLIPWLSIKLALKKNADDDEDIRLPTHSFTNSRRSGLAHRGTEGNR